MIILINTVHCGIALSCRDIGASLLLTKRVFLLFFLAHASLARHSVMKLGKLLKDGSWIVFGVVAVDLSVDVLAVLTARLVFRDAVQLAIAVDDAVRISNCANGNPE